MSRGQNWETLVPHDAAPTRATARRAMASACKAFVQRKPNFDGIDVSGITTTTAPTR